MVEGPRRVRATLFRRKVAVCYKLDLGRAERRAAAQVAVCYKLTRGWNANARAGFVTKICSESSRPSSRSSRGLKRANR
jgi:hypothetical protein